jgi:X-Pro dipeptidyl-peptidase
MPRLLPFTTLLLLLALAAPAAAQDTVTETLHVPTVDGAEVSVEVTRPKEGRVPVILTYSPYNVINEPSPSQDGFATTFVPKGYARAVADVLGTRNSSGCWDYGGPKEQQSGVDLVNFLSTRPWSTGKVAMIGGSYDGTTANMVAARGADVPGLAAIVPIAAISHWYGYAYFGGIRYSGNSQNPADEGFDTPLAFDYGFSKTPPSDPTRTQAAIDHAKPCDSVAHTQRGYDTSPDYDQFWLERDYAKDGAKFRVPTLLAHGWQDFNVKQDEALRLWDSVSRAPWKGLFMFQGAHGSPSGEQWTSLLDAFFARFLKGEPVPLPGRIHSQPRTAAADGTLEALASWPPPRTGDVELALGRGSAGGTLGSPDGAPATFSDPGTMTEEVASEDLASEGAWLAYRSEPVGADLRIAGSPALDLTIAASRDHGHLTPTLWDEAPDGKLTPITRGFLNLAYRDGLAAGKPVPAGAPVRAVVGLLPQDWIVEKGHRIAVSVAASNTAWGVPDQPGLEVEVRHGGASRLLLPVVGAGKDPSDGRTPITGGRQPGEALPSTREARAKLRVSVRRLRGGRLRVTGTAPRRTSVFLRLKRGSRVVAARGASARTGRFTATFKARRAGRYRVEAMLRTRDGVLTKRSRAVRVR